MEKWKLKPCDNINRILKIRTDLDNLDKSLYPFLLTLSHKYATSDDILFPEAATLAFFKNFEENLLEKLENAVYTAQDINTGIIDTHIYVNDYQAIIHEIISFINSYPTYHFEFKVTGDSKWQIVKNLE